MKFEEGDTVAVDGRTVAKIARIFNGNYYFDDGTYAPEYLCSLVVKQEPPFVMDIDERGLWFIRQKGELIAGFWPDKLGAYEWLFKNS